MFGSLPPYARHHVRRSILLGQRGFAAASSPPSKTTKKMNCGKALIKAHESDSFASILPLDVTTLQGIGPKHQEQLHSLRLKTVQDLANYKFFHMAKALVALAETEQDEDSNGKKDEKENDGEYQKEQQQQSQPQESFPAIKKLNVNKAVDKAYETQSFRDIVQAPVSALQGITDETARNVWRHLGVKTVGDLAKFKYCVWAEAMQTAAKYEEKEE